MTAVANHIRKKLTEAGGIGYRPQGVEFPQEQKKVKHTTVRR